MQKVTNTFKKQLLVYDMNKKMKESGKMIIEKEIYDYIKVKERLGGNVHLYILIK